MIGPWGDCGHLIDHRGTSRLCLTCQRAKDRYESDLRAGVPVLDIPAGLVRAGVTPDPRIGVVPDECPGCFGYLNASRDIDGDERPKPDDRTICIHCGAFMKYLNDLRLQLLTPEELAETLRLLNPQERAAVAALARRREAKAGRA